MNDERLLREFANFILQNPIETINLENIEEFECNLADGEHVNRDYIMNQLSDISGCIDFYFNYKYIKIPIERLEDDFFNGEDMSEEDDLFFYAEYKGDRYLVKAYVKFEFEYTLNKTRFGESYEPKKFKVKEINPMRVIPLD